MNKKLIAFIFSLFIVQASFSQIYQWTKTFSGFDDDFGGIGEQKVKDLANDSEGNVYLAGEFTGAMDFDPNDGKKELKSKSNVKPDIFIEKLDKNGDLIWVKTFGPDFQVQSLAVDASGNVFFAGFSEKTEIKETGLGEEKTIDRFVFIKKLNTEGELLWTKNLGKKQDFIQDIIADPKGNICLVGNFDNGNYVVQLNSKGNELWKVKTSSQQNIYTSNISTDSKGNFYLSGYQNPREGDAFGDEKFDFLVYATKFSSTGKILWKKGFSVEGENSGLLSVSSTSDAEGNLFISGQFDDNVKVLMENGEVKTFKDEEKAYSQNRFGFIVVKINTKGEFVWFGSYGKSGNKPKVQKITCDSKGGLYVIGEYASHFDFPLIFTAHFGQAEYSFMSKGETDVFVCKIDGSGFFTWANAFGGEKEDGAKGITIDKSGNIYLSGTFTGEVDFNPGKEKEIHKSTKNSKDVYLWKTTTKF